MKLNKIVGKKLPLGALLSLIAMIVAFPANARAAGNSSELNDVVETAVAAGQFKTLAAALEAAGLIDALKGNGPFTVFAPTDAAFAKVPQQTLNDLLRPENKKRLAAILTYHVVPGKVTSHEVIAMIPRLRCRARN